MPEKFIPEELAGRESSLRPASKEYLVYLSEAISAPLEDEDYDPAQEKTVSQWLSKAENLAQSDPAVYRDKALIDKMVGLRQALEQVTSPSVENRRHWNEKTQQRLMAVSVFLEKQLKFLADAEIASLQATGLEREVERNAISADKSSDEIIHDLQVWLNSGN